MEYNPPPHNSGLCLVTSYQWVHYGKSEGPKNNFMIKKLKKHCLILIRSDQSLSRVQLFMTPWITALQASLSITNSRSSLRLTSIESVMLSSHLILCRPLIFLPPILLASESFPMSQLFTCGGQSTRVSAWASFLPKNTQDQSPLELTVWISLQSKGLSSLLQHHSSKASILWRSAFFKVQLSHPYMTTGKTIS